MRFVILESDGKVSIEISTFVLWIDARYLRSYTILDIAKYSPRDTCYLARDTRKPRSAWKTNPSFKSTPTLHLTTHLPLSKTSLEPNLPHGKQHNLGYLLQRTILSICHSGPVFTSQTQILGFFPDSRLSTAFRSWKFIYWKKLWQGRGWWWWEEWMNYGLFEGRD